MRYQIKSYINFRYVGSEYKYSTFCRNNAEERNVYGYGKC